MPHPIQLDSDPARVSKREAEHQLRIEVYYDASVEGLDEAKKFVVKENVRGIATARTSSLVRRSHWHVR